MRYLNANRKDNLEPAALERDADAPADSHGARSLHRMLEEQLRRPPVPPPDAETTEAVSEGAASPQAEPAAKSRIPVRFVKVALGIAIVAVFGWMPLRTLLQPTSVEAIVNSRVVTVRAPIEGEVTAALTGLSGSGVIEKNESLLHIRNVRADRTRLDSLNDRLGGLRIERLANLARIASTQQAHDAMAEDVELFAEARIRQLEARAAALESDIAAAGARHEVAAAAADRADTLARSGSISAAELQRVTLERTVAEQTEASAEHQLDAVRVELEALRAGRFVGDGYNDRPSTAEHRDELRRKLDDLYTSLSATQAEIARLEQEVAAESERYRELSDVAVSLPVAGRVWEVLTAPGEQVRQGQDLLKILDCSGAVVTANVTESVYNRLSVGSPARFRPTDGGPDLGGTVANLTGLAAAPANLAILPSALAREAYRVTVQVPALSADATCAIGRTGRVIFDKAPAAAS